MFTVIKGAARDLLGYPALFGTAQFDAAKEHLFGVEERVVGNIKCSVLIIILQRIFEYKDGALAFRNYAKVLEIFRGERNFNWWLPSSGLE